MLTNFLYLFNLLRATKSNKYVEELNAIECPHCKEKQFIGMTADDSLHNTDHEFQETIPLESNLYCECEKCKKPFVISAKAKIKLKVIKIEVPN